MRRLPIDPVLSRLTVYAAISKELGLPLRFPGKPGAYDKLMEMTDAGLLAKATVWAATQPQCANHAFNIASGDLFRWNDLWPKIAEYFDVKVGSPLQMSLQTVMADKEDLWKAMQAKYKLKAVGYQEISSWTFGDAVFGWDYDFLVTEPKHADWTFMNSLIPNKCFTNYWTN